MRGRCGCDSSTCRFQSAPAIAGGRCRVIGLLQAQNGLVSIRARHCWRAMPSPTPNTRSPSRCFNPRPPLLAGDDAGMDKLNDLYKFQSAPAIAGGRCGSQAPGHGALRVSIRARHCWRAMLVLMVVTVLPMLFQSAPAIAGGRCIDPHDGTVRYVGFNPRPPLLAGDAVVPRQPELRQ